MYLLNSKVAKSKNYNRALNKIKMEYSMNKKIPVINKNSLELNTWYIFQMWLHDVNSDGTIAW